MRHWNWSLILLYVITALLFACVRKSEGKPPQAPPMVKRIVQAPSVIADKPAPAPPVVPDISEKSVKDCPCSAACTCGCNSGAVCECNGPARKGSRPITVAGVFAQRGASGGCANGSCGVPTSASMPRQAPPVSSAVPTVGWADPNTWKSPPYLDIRGTRPTAGMSYQTQGTGYTGGSMSNPPNSNPPMYLSQEDGSGVSAAVGKGPIRRVFYRLTHPLGGRLRAGIRGGCGG